LLDFEFGFMHCCLKEHAEQSSHSYSLKSRLKPYLLLRYAYLLKGSVAKLKNKCLTLCLK
ncbi:hypothetical protein, partial [Staphylococcus aureus]